MSKSPDKYFMSLGKYAYDPFSKDGFMYVRVVHRGYPECKSVVQVQHNGSGYAYRLISSTMPIECVAEFMPVLQRNMAFMVRWGINA